MWHSGKRSTPGFRPEARPPLPGVGRFIDLVFHNTAVVRGTVAAGKAATDILLADLKKFRLDALFVERVNDFIQSSRGAAAFLRTAVDDQNFV